MSNILGTCKIVSRFDTKFDYNSYSLSEVAQYLAAFFFDLRTIHFLTIGSEFYTYHSLAEDLYETTEDYYDDLVESAIGYNELFVSMNVIPDDWEVVNPNLYFDLNTNKFVPQVLIFDRLKKIFDILQNVRDYDSGIRSKLDAMMEYYDKEIYKLSRVLKAVEVF